MEPELAFEFEWVDPQGAKGDELRATWARLTIRTNGEVVTRLFDRRSDTVRDSIFAPLYPLAEWLVTHWWSLCYEGQRARTAGDGFYRVRHSLASSREGYTFPALTCESEIAQVRVSWTRERLQTHRAEFISEGTSYIPLALFQRSVSNFVDAVSARLEERGIVDTLLQSEWRAILAADDDERAFCQAAAALGLDPYSLSDEDRDAVLRAGERLGDSLQAEFFAAVDVGTLDTSVSDLIAAFAKTRNTNTDLRGLLDFRKVIHDRLRGALIPNAAPWLNGYRAADVVREALNMDGQPLRSLDEVAKKFGLQEAELSNSIVEAAIPVDAAIDTNERGSPAFVLPSGRRETGRRFHFCRSLLEFLIQNVPHPALITNSSSYSQKMNRAFAAELLAPTSGIERELNGNVAYPDEIENLAEYFNVPQLVILHQLENHRLAMAFADSNWR